MKIKSPLTDKKEVKALVDVGASEFFCGIEPVSWRKKFKDFSLKSAAGEFFEGEVIGCLGPNAIGKTTFVKMLAGMLKPDNIKLDLNLKVAYKPQYLKPEQGVVVSELFHVAGAYQPGDPVHPRVWLISSLFHAIRPESYLLRMWLLPVS